MASTAGHLDPALGELGEPRPHGSANARVEDPLQVAQRAGVAEHDARQLVGLVGPESALDLGPRVGVVVADLAGDGVGVDRRHPDFAEHARPRCSFRSRCCR